MQFSDTSDKEGIIEMIDELCQTDSTSFSIEQKTRGINNAQDYLFTEQILVAGSRQPDDRNHAGVSKTTVAFTSGDREFLLPTGTYFIEYMEIDGKNGGKKEIKLIDKASDRTVWGEHGSGEPDRYDMNGDYYVFDKTFDYAGNITLYTTRETTQFAKTDTTKEAGFRRVLSQFMAYWTSVEYCTRNHPEFVPLYEKRVEQLLRMARRLVKKDKSRIRPYVVNRNAMK